MMKKITIAVLFTGFLYFPFPFHQKQIYADDEAQKQYSLEELVRLALEKYEQIKIEESKIREARELGKHLSEWYNPELGIAAGKKSSDGASGPEWSATVTQRLSFPGKKGLMEEIALIEQSRAQLSTAELKLFVRYEVTRLAYEYAYHLQRKRHVADRLKRFQLIHAYMAGRIVVPPEKKVEQAIVQTRIAMLQKEVYKVDADIASVCARMNLFTGFSGFHPEIKVRWFQRPPSVEGDILMKKAKEFSFPVRLQKEMLAAAQKNKELEERIAYPDVGISLYYNDARAEVHERSFGGGLSFTIPLFSRNRHAVAIAEEKIKAEEQKLVLAQKRAVEDMKALLAQHEYIGAMLAKFSINDIKNIEEKMRYTDLEFKKGRVPLTMYLEMDASVHGMLEEIFHLQLDLVSIHTSLRFLAAEEVLLEGDL